MTMNRLFHLFSKEENVLFRSDSDYIFFSNKFASSCHACQISPLAETTMSTHFHSVVEACDEMAVKELAAKIKTAYSHHYSAEYGFALGKALAISHLELSGRESAMNELLYVMKNPVHHYVVSDVLAYPYSSAFYLFMDKLMPAYFIETMLNRTRSAGQLAFHSKKEIVGRDDIPDSWLIMDNGMILPTSYLSISRARAFWNNSVKSFLYDLNRNQTDARKEVIQADVLDIRSSGMSDIEVCRVIDGFVAEVQRRSFHFLKAEESSRLQRVLAMRAVPKEQVRRCLWL